jgi:S1-C subfamily serine protease
MKHNLLKSFVIIILFNLVSLSAFASETVDVTIVDYDVTVNGTRILTEESQYPVLSYNSITYFPMTSDYLSGLGLKLHFSNEEGLEISNSSSIGEFNQKFLGVNTILGSKVRANIAPFAISVNSTEINNSEEEYPILLYNNITYFPMTWRFARTDFKWITAWSEEEGFGITVNGIVNESSEENKAIDTPIPTDSTTPDKKLSSAEIDKLSEAVVKVQIETQKGSIFTCSGFYINEREIVVPFRYISIAKDIKIMEPDGTSIYNEVIMSSFNADRDLAILYVAEDSNTFLELSDEPLNSLGEHIYSITSNWDEGVKITEGTVSALDYNLIELTAPMEAVGSGGVLLNDYGQVVGMMDYNSEYEGQDLSFAVPSIHLNDMTRIYDIDNQQYINPFSAEVAPVKNITNRFVEDNIVEINWDYNYADYYKVYVSVNGSKYKDYTQNNENMWMWFHDGSVYIEINNGDAVAIYVTAVKNGIESGYKETITILTPKCESNIDFLEEQLLDESGVIETPNYSIPISKYFVNVNASDEAVYAFAFIEEGFFEEALSASRSEVDISYIKNEIEQLARNVSITLETYTYLYFVFSGTEKEYDSFLAEYDFYGEAYVDNGDGTWTVFFPIAVTGSDPNGVIGFTSQWQENITNNY